MNSSTRIVIVCISSILLAGSLTAQDAGKIALNPPDTTRGVSVMKALAARASGSTYDSTEITLRDLSDVVWAANGVNRPATGKRTAPSAMNAQDIDVYVCLTSGLYLYDAQKHVLVLVAEGDHRNAVAGGQPQMATAPLFVVLVSDISRFKTGAEADKRVWGAEDAGIVSENISLFCASVGLATRPRATMDRQTLGTLLKLTASQQLILNHPVSYPRK